MKDMDELNHYLGMKVIRTDILSICCQYVKDMISKYSYLLIDGLEQRHFDTPMKRYLKLQTNDIDTETAKKEFMQSNSHT